MSKPDKTNGRKLRDPATARRFLQELSWLLSTYDSLDFRILKDLVFDQNRGSLASVSTIDNYVSENPNIHFLVGVLPRILNDEAIFPTNEDIAIFAKDVLGVVILRWGKKSKYELIGHIVCNVYKLNDIGLTNLVHALAKLLTGDSRAKTLVRADQAKKRNWNEIIQELSQEKDL